MLAKQVVRVCLMLLSLALICPLASEAAPAPGTLSLRLGGGFGTQSLSDVNADIDADRDLFNLVGYGVDWDKFGGAGSFGGEIGYQFSPIVSGGIGIAYQKGSVKHSANLDFTDTGGVSYLGDTSEKQEISVLDIVGTVTLWMTQAPGLYLGGQLGLARGEYEETGTLFLSGSDGSFLDLQASGKADGTSLSAGIYGGYEYEASANVALSGRLGYRFCNLGKLDGTLTTIGDSDVGPIFDTSTGPVTDSNGNPMDFDLSGVQVSAAVVMRFGRTP